MIYVCVCDGEVIGFAGVYAALISAGVVCSDLCSDPGYYCFVGFSWKKEESIFAYSLDLLMSEVGRYFPERTIYNPVYLSDTFDYCDDDDYVYNPDAVYLDHEEVSDSYPVGYLGGDLEEWQRQRDGALADYLYG